MVRRCKICGIIVAKDLEEWSKLREKYSYEEESYIDFEYRDGLCFDCFLFEND